MQTNRLQTRLAIVLLVIYFGLGTLFAWRVPAWQAPDEPAHYNYIAQVANGELLPVIEMGDWDNAYLEQLKAQDFASELLEALPQVQYENHQPPLYYWLAAPVFVLSDGSLFFVRMVSVTLGIITLAISYRISVRVFPGRNWLALAVMALIAFLPQNLHILASVNNDALAGLLIALTLWLCVRYLQQDQVSVWSLGMVVGLIFITKVTAYFMAGIVVLVILIRWWATNGKRISALVLAYVKFGVPAAVFALLYWGRNVLTYGFPDFLGLQAHDAIVVGQLRRTEFVAQNGLSAYWREAFLTTFHSFWGQFGWMEARLADALPFTIWYFAGVMLVAIVGLALRLFSMMRPVQSTSSHHRSIWVVLALMILLACLQYIAYNLTFVQFQGRYLFVAIIPFAIAVVYGLDAVRYAIVRDATKGVSTIFWILAIMAPLNLYLIWRIIPCAVGCT